MGHDLPLLVVVTGSPASGKTTLAQALSDELHLPLIAKDAIKEELYDTLEGANPEDSHRLGFVAVSLLHSWATRLLEKHVSLILESNFKRSLSVDGLEALFVLSRPVLVQCIAPDEHVVERYVERSAKGDRHPVHDDANHVEELRRDLMAGEYDLRCLDVPSVEVDTAHDTPDIQDLIIRIRTMSGAELAP